MKILFASDSFKGTLSSAKIGQLLEKAAKEVFPNCECFSLEIADGGEGTADAVLAAAGGERINLMVHDPLGNPVNAYYGKLNENCAVMEMAAASGLPLVPVENRNPLYTSTYGTGEMIKDALLRGFRKISIAIGGSATNDGGMGCMRALGIRFLDGDGNELAGCGEDLIKVRKIDTTGVNPYVREAEFTVMCDVNNPLCGPQGATYTYGPQKGATPEILEKLEEGMKNYRAVIHRQFSIDPDSIPGAGAAGGLGCALRIFLGASLESGIETVLDLINFDEFLGDISFVVTGEGRTDGQSVCGKVMSGIGEHCANYGIPVVAIVGGMGDGAEKVYEHGIFSMITTVNSPMTLEHACSNAEKLYLDAAVRMLRLIRTGMELKIQRQPALMSNPYKSFIDNVLMQHGSSKTQLENSCTAIGLEYEKNRICFVFEFPELAETAEPEQSSKLEECMTYIKKHMQDFIVGRLLLIPFEYRVIGFQVYKQEIPRITMIANHENFFAELTDDIRKDLQLENYIGISETGKGITTIAMQYIQAMESLTFGRRIRLGTVYSYHEEYLFHVLYHHFTRQELKELINNILEPVINADNEMGNNDLKNTLEEYVRCSGNMTQTANHLYIHRNTLTYRMDKIKSLLAIKKVSADDFTRYMVALTMLKLLS